MTHTFKTTVCLLIILGLLLPYFAMASLSEIAGAPKCAIKNALRNILRDVGEAIRNFLKAVIRTAVCATVSFFTGGLIGCGPDKVEDSATSQNIAKEFVYDPVARCISRGIFDKSINGVLALVREGGRDGGESWIKNWRNFETNAEYRGENIFRAELSNTQMCSYFDKDLKNTFGVKGKTSLNGVNTRTGNLDPFSLRANCTMPSSFNMQSYQNDFSGNGGWNAWSRMLEPQNNYYGSLFMSLDEANKQRNIEKSADLNQALAGLGYLSISGDGKTAASSCKTRDPNGKCLVYNDIKTPGSTIGDSVSATVEQELAWVVSSDELNELLVDISDRLVSRLKDLRSPDKEAPIEIVGEYQGGNYTGLPDPEDPLPPSGGAEVQVACTTLGPEEQNFMLPLLNGGISPQEVVTMTNQQFGLTYGNEAVYYPNNNTIGLPEFYLAGPTASRPVSPSTGLPWDVVVRCSSGGGGLCSDTGTGVANYSGYLRTSLDAVIANNPNGVADLPYTQTNGVTFLNFVAQELQSMGLNLNATTSVLNGNGNLNPSGDLIGIWRVGDGTLERYDALRSGQSSIRNATWTDFTGDIPLNCAP